jgi:hypothetical protein
MARPVRVLLALLAIGGGCATQTIDLLPPSGNGGGLSSGGAGGEGGEGALPADCTTDLECAPSRPHCAPIFGTSRSHCVECVEHTNCGPLERCNFLTNQCAPACTTFDQCPGELPFCERGVCIQCQTDSHCGPNVCVFGHCEECRSTLDCPPSAPVCNEAFVCRPCDGMFQCGQYRYCDLSTGRCEPF